MACLVFKGSSKWAHGVGDDGVEIGVVGPVVGDSEVLNRISIVRLILSTCGELHQLE
jgi:hypothetical protein